MYFANKFFIPFRVLFIHIHYFGILQEYFTDFMRNVHPGIFIIFIVLKRFDHFSYLIFLRKFYLLLILALFTKGLFFVHFSI